MEKMTSKTGSAIQSSRIIIPVDTSDKAKIAVEKALFIAKQTGKDILALYVIETPAITPDNETYSWEDTLIKQGLEILDDVEKKGSELGIKVIKKVVKGSPEEVIIQETEINDLIIIGCNESSAVDRLLIGSICEKVSHQASSPVMVV
jgi:nucleotide-binding universal stress UspA family protein